VALRNKYLLGKPGSFLNRLVSGFGQDRVDFHQKPGGDTARQPNPVWPSRTGYSKSCHAVFRVGELGGGKAV